MLGRNDKGLFASVIVAFVHLLGGNFDCSRASFSYIYFQ